VHAGFATDGSQLLGYILRSVFFEHDFIELVYVDEAFRQQGIGRALMTKIEAVRRTPKLFTSTNESNAVMRAMLGRLSYAPSGVIHNLNPGDGELFFVKEFAAVPLGEDLGLG
jgi:GNAT superfamily N-acetyltransferase